MNINNLEDLRAAGGVELHYLPFRGHTKILVEASPLDCIWGAGLAYNDPRLNRPPQWPSLNLLGFVLMRLRAEWAAGLFTNIEALRL